MSHSRRVLSLVTLLLALFSLGATVSPEATDYDYIYVSVSSDGMTEDGLEYQRSDILGSAGLGQPWFTYFDGQEYGLTTQGVNAFDFEAVMPASNAVAPTEPIYMSFGQNRVRVPDIPGWVYAHDVVKFIPDGLVNQTYTYEMYFDGSDVGLTTNTERLDSLSVYDMSGPFAALVPDDCAAGVLFVSTMRNYRVPAADGGSLTGPGGDILAFCASNLGPDTAGVWYRAFSAVAAGLSPRVAIRSLSIQDFGHGPGPNDWWLEFAFVARTDFTVGSYEGTANTIYLYDTAMGVEEEILNLNYDYPMLNGQVSALLVYPAPIVCGAAC